VAHGVIAGPEPVQLLTFRLSGGNESVLAGQVLDYMGAPSKARGLP